MDKHKKSFFYFKRWVMVFLILAIFLEGCEPLRKKFTRKKKVEETTQEVPVLEPVEYPARAYTSEDLYKQHLSLFKVWYKELLASLLDDKASRKRRLYLLGQVLTQLEELQKLIAEEKQRTLISALDNLKKIKEDLGAPVPTNNATSFKRKLESIERKILGEYAFQDIKESLR